MKKILSIAIFFLTLSSFLIAQKNEKGQLATNASFYHDKFHGLETSNGEIYDKDNFTAAHLTFPFNTFLLVKNKITDKSVIVRVNDRGPFKRSRVIDLSFSAAKKIGMVKYGVVPVKIEVLTYLDSSPFAPASLPENSIWDSRGNPQQLSDVSILIWQTDNWKHAFYMASHLLLEKEKNLLVRIEGGKRKSYSLLVSGIKEKQKAVEFLKEYRNMGFTHARILKLDSSKVGQRAYQPSK